MTPSLPYDAARPRRRPRSCPALLAALLALSACGADTGGEEGGEVARHQAADRPAAGPAADSGLTAVDPWVRVAIMPDSAPAEGAPPVNGAAYLVLRNGTGEDDALVAVESAVSDTVELHTVSMDDGIMRMRAVDAVPVPAGGEGVLAPGGFHIMLIGLHAPLLEGDTVQLTLRLQSGRTLQLAAPVRRDARHDSRAQER